MIIISASPDVNLSLFLKQIRESECKFIVESFAHWKNNTSSIPEAFVYLRVTPEISYKRLIDNNQYMSLQMLHSYHNESECYFINNTTREAHLIDVPTLILNGNMCFEADFSQFYTHLFAIKKLYQNIQDQKAKDAGTYVERKKHTKCRC
jgi:hypothetical protein